MRNHLSSDVDHNLDIAGTRPESRGRWPENSGGSIVDPTPMQPFLDPPAITIATSNSFAHCKAVGRVHTGKQYHEFMLLSRRDRRVRESFQKMALDFLPRGADVLDFGAGTGLDAKVFAANGHLTFVYEPSQAMRDCLVRYCRDEIARETVIPVTRPLVHKVQAVTANFAVLNHIVDHRSLFEEFARVVDRGGFLLASMLSPWYLGDARHRWWWMNMPNLVRSGCYPSPGESRIHRYAPNAVARAASPYFRPERLVPRFGLPTHLYMFLLFRRV